MGTLTALVLATPIFGLSLTPPTIGALPTSAAPTALYASELSEEEDETGLEEASSENEDEVPDEAAARTVRGPALDKDAYRMKLKKRAKLTSLHRTLGISTWALTGIAVIAGTIQWRNLYAGSASNNPCVTGDAWLGQKQCYGQPWFHELTGIASGAAYFTTLTVAMVMPDPDDASKGTSAYAKNLRTHKMLRWVHLSGMVAQMVMGVVLANPRISGLDRSNDYGTLKALSFAHLGIGYVTFGALSWAGYIML